MIIAPTPAWTSPLVELFPLEPRHVTDAYVAWLNDAQINRYLESRFQQHTLDSTRAFVDGCVESDKAMLLGLRCPWLDNRHVGNIKIETNANHRLGEVGVLIGEKQVHGKGIATEAIRMTSNIARSQLGLRKLSAGCYASNKGSERAFVKAGFTVEGGRPGHFLVDGRPENLVLLGLLL